mgnify:CR=1 FL=1
MPDNNTSNAVLNHGEKHPLDGSGRECLDVPYMQRTRDLYRAQGYSKDYVWAHFEETPFTAPSKPLRESRVTVITTTMPDTEIGRTSRQIHSCPSEPVPQSMYTEELSWHKTMTHTDDVGSFLPLGQLSKLVKEGVIAGLSRSFHCLPTEYSQGNTSTKDGPEILRRCQSDGADIALLVPL